MRILLPLALGFLAACSSAPRPDIVFILVDDLRFDDLSCNGHPFAQSPNIDRIAREGGNFKRAFVTTPLCSPSRASILTGQYAHRHSITDNTDRSPASHQLDTFPRRLHEAGYRTGFIGKWHMGNDDSARPGFDDWFALKGQGDSIDPSLNDNGKQVKLAGYVTDLLTDRAVRFIQQAEDRPFCLYLSHKAIHPQVHQMADGKLDGSADHFIPADRHRDLYNNASITRRPNALKPPTGKPALNRAIEGLPPLSPATGTGDEQVKNRLRMLAGIDESTGRIYDALRKAGRLDRAFLVFFSDNGYFYGEHGLSVERRLAYEESIHMPLLIRFPTMIKPGSVYDPMVLNIDLAPTFLELGRASIASGIQGKSLLPLLRDPAAKLRDEFLIEYHTDAVFPRIKNMGYQAARTGRWKYIHYLQLTGSDELYDLQADPYEMNNLIHSPAARAELEKMKATLTSLQDQAR